MNAAQEFISDLAEKIPLPTIYWQIRLLMNNPNAKIGDYERLIQGDPQLTTHTILIANSEFFGFGRKVDGLYDAISLIGVGQLHDLLLGSLCMRTFANIPGQAMGHLNVFWRQAIKRGIAARTVAKFCRMPSSNQFFTVGFFLEIGHVAMTVKAPDLAFKTLQQSQQQQRPIYAVERENFGFDYCQLGAELLRKWCLPEFYPQVLENHLYPEQAKPNIQTETEIAYLAYCLCDASELEEHRRTRILNADQELTVKEIVDTEITDHVDEIFAMLRPANQ